MSLSKVRFSREFWQNFGPGLLWAATAIGVSHLVQSTRAGASGGLAYASVILLALILKYPFFEAGPRYAASMGESLIEGYRRVGKWALWLYLFLTVATSIIVQSAVVLFTAVLLKSVLASAWPLAWIGGALALGCAVLLWVGRYRVLDWSIKAMIVVLSVSTLTAALVVLPRVDLSTLFTAPIPTVTSTASLAFLLALIGWMPSGVDTAAWSSLWTEAKGRTSGVAIRLPDALLDFRIGYLGTGVLAFAFLILGAGVMHGSGEEFSPRGASFSVQLVDLYALSLGEWSRPIIVIAAITAMVSTCFAVIDGFPRAIDRALRIVATKTEGERVDPRVGRYYWTGILTLLVLTILVIANFLGNMTTMINFATIVSFLTAPILGFLNLRVVTGDWVEEEARPGVLYRWTSYLGLMLLGGTAVIFLVTRFV